MRTNITISSISVHLISSSDKMLESVKGIKRFCVIQRLALRCLGFDITSVESKIRRPFWVFLIFILNFISLLAIGKYGWENTDDLNKLLAALAPVLDISVCTIKFLIFLKKRKDLLKLLHDIWILTIEGELFGNQKKKTLNILIFYSQY